MQLVQVLRSQPACQGWRSAWGGLLRPAGCKTNLHSSSSLTTLGLYAADTGNHPVEHSPGLHQSDTELKWRKTYRLSGQGSQNQCSVLTEDGFTIESDIPLSMGGGNTAPQPVLLLLAALAGCETATANFVARRSSPRIRIRGISFEIEAWRDQRGAIGLPLSNIDEAPAAIPSMLQVVSGTAVVDTDATQQQIDSLADQVHRRCPVASMMMASGCHVDIKWLRKAAAV